MTARFKKGLQQVSLVNESADDDDYDVQGESDMSVLISEDEMTKEHGPGGISQEEGLGSLPPASSAGKRDWKFWKKKKRYVLNHNEDRELVILGRKCRPCGVNSWRAIFLALFAFSVTITVSLIISKLAVEPPIDTEGGVALDNAVCARMSADILLRNGSAVDAAITGMLCNGVVQPESSGIGGGGFMTIRLKNGSVYVLNFRETAPLAATEDMFHSNASLANTGGLSVAVPGELKGMEMAHKLFGWLEWEELFQPVVELCRNGFSLTEHCANALEAVWDVLPENLKKVYSLPDGSIKKAGDMVTRPDLADTLESISTDGVSAFYENGKIAQSIIASVRNSDGILTQEDLDAYQVKMEEPLQTQFNGYTFFSPPSPGGGATFLYMLSLLDLFHQNAASDLDLAYHRLVEVFKFAFAGRTRLGDPFCDEYECEDISQEIMEEQMNVFNETYLAEIWGRISDEQTFNVSYYDPAYSILEDSGTSHLSVLSPQGDAVAVTTTVNTYFGSKLFTDTGIVLNNEMDDFSAPNINNSFGVPPSEYNFIRPRKRPLSSTCPTIGILTESNGETRPLLIIGASGGTHIPTSVAQSIWLLMTFEQSLSDAIESRKLHHQLVPNIVTYEEGFPKETIKFLEEKGHTFMQFSGSSSAVTQGVALDHKGLVTVHADTRKQGEGIVVTLS